MNPESVQVLGDAELVRHREIDALALAAIAQGRIVYFHFRFHAYPRDCGKLNLYAKTPRVANHNS